MSGILSVVGARPQFVKAAVVSAVLREAGRTDEILVHTGQHYDAAMSAVFFEELGLPAPAVNLEVGSGSHAAQTAAMLRGLEEVVLERQPSVVMVYGDTNSTLAGALVAAKLGVPLAHVEAGLRSFNRAMPEEINRVVTDHLAELLFVPTEAGRINLEHEGRLEFAHVVGDVMYDAVLRFGHLAESRKIVSELGLAPGQYALATIHRAENTDDPARLGVILDALDRIGRELPVLWPVHPRTEKAIATQGLEAGHVRFVPPVGYLDMLALERSARVILTDSGGVQKEAFFARVPCVTLRAETEWTELVEAGWNRLAPPVMAATIVEAAHAALDQLPAPPEGLYGGGKAAGRIAEILENRFPCRASSG
jgi:UDP-GlcNAc3NAcA epimerase